jgi:hypothetical protein
MVHEYPDGIAGNKVIKVHGSPKFYVTREHAWEEYKDMKRIWINACD